MQRTSSELSPEEYAEEVYYCKNCHSLKILIDESLAIGDWDGSYCGKCHSSDIGVCAFGDWLAEEERHAEQRRKIEWNK